jgi:putative transposase
LVDPFEKQSSGQPPSRATSALSDIDLPLMGRVVHLRGYSFIKVFRTVDPHGNADHGATNRLEITPVHRKMQADRAWLIEDYHRSLKQSTGIQTGQFCLEIAQRHHIGSAMCTFIRLEFHRWQHRVAIFDAKLNIIRQALRLYLAQPTLVLSSTA